MDEYTLYVNILYTLYTCSLTTLHTELDISIPASVLSDPPSHTIYLCPTGPTEYLSVPPSPTNYLCPTSAADYLSVPPSRTNYLYCIPLLPAPAATSTPVLCRPGRRGSGGPVGGGRVRGVPALQRCGALHHLLPGVEVQRLLLRLRHKGDRRRGAGQLQVHTKTFRKV